MNPGVCNYGLYSSNLQYRSPAIVQQNFLGGGIAQSLGRKAKNISHREIFTSVVLLLSLWSLSANYTRTTHHCYFSGEFVMKNLLSQQHRWTFFPSVSCVIAILDLI